MVETDSRLDLYENRLVWEERYGFREGLFGELSESIEVDLYEQFAGFPRKRFQRT